MMQFHFSGQDIGIKDFHMWEQEISMMFILKEIWKNKSLWLIILIQKLTKLWLLQLWILVLLLHWLIKQCKLMLCQRRVNLKQEKLQWKIWKRELELRREPVNAKEINAVKKILWMLESEKIIRNDEENSV